MMVQKKYATNVLVVIIGGIIVVAIIQSLRTATIVEIDHYFHSCSAMLMPTVQIAHSHHRHRWMATHSPPFNCCDAPPDDIHGDDVETACDAPTITSSFTTKNYWKLRTQRRQYEQDNKILYVKSALTPTEFATLSTEMTSMMMNAADSSNKNTIMKLQNEDASSSFATNRIGARVPTNSDTDKILRHGSISRIVNELYGENNSNNNEMILAPNIPIEVRVYEKVGAGMEWHVDDVLYCPRQVEIVLTLENTSDCCTMWRVPIGEEKCDDAHCINGINDDKPFKMAATTAAAAFRVHSIQTAPNSILILESGGVEHKVTPLSYGKRTILKMAFVSKHAVMDESMEKHVSHHQIARRTRTATTNQKKKEKSKTRRHN
jgi:hypothetical protein